MRAFIRLFEAEANKELPKQKLNMTSSDEWFSILMAPLTEKSIQDIARTINFLEAEAGAVWDLEQMTAEEFIRQLLVSKFKLSLKAESSKRTVESYVKEHHNTPVHRLLLDMMLKLGRSSGKENHRRKNQHQI